MLHIFEYDPKKLTTTNKSVDLFANRICTEGGLMAVLVLVLSVAKHLDTSLTSLAAYIPTPSISTSNQTDQV